MNRSGKDNFKFLFGGKLFFKSLNLKRPFWYYDVMSPLIYIFDLVGTFAFAILGAEAALKKKFDIFGVVFAGLLTAFASGTIREILLGDVPSYFLDNLYVLAAFLGISFAIVSYSSLKKLYSIVLIIDAMAFPHLQFSAPHGRMRQVWEYSRLSLLQL